MPIIQVNLTDEQIEAFQIQLREINANRNGQNLDPYTEEEYRQLVIEKLFNKMVFNYKEDQKQDMWNAYADANNQVQDQVTGLLFSKEQEIKL